MTRYTDLDGDSERLPEGFKRIGYDADNQTYSFSSPDGRIYLSEAGNRYGRLWPADEPRPQRTERELEEQEEAIENDSRESMRMMLPFALLVLIFLILVFKFIA